MKTTDTICAISTSLTPGGIGIVRLSGEDAVTIADKIYKGKKKLAECESHTINYGYVVDGDETVDQVLVMLMRAPRTYTGEDVVEFDCHGGPLVLKRVLALALSAGALLAEPGEFTKRAFLNGKIDLSQAEAVADVIDAENELALRSGMKQLRGKLSREVSFMRDTVREELAFIEAALDDPEHYDFAGYGQKLSGKVELIQNRINKLLEDSKSGIVMKSGVDTVIVGRPNAGKSSVYNLLAGEDRAIVTDIAGTTRDTLTEHVMVGEVKLNLTDTAGLHDSDDVVEKIGVERARKAAEDAELIIAVVDGTQKLSEEDGEVFKLIKDKNYILLINKSDISETAEPFDYKSLMNWGISTDDGHVIEFSAITGNGFVRFKEIINEMFLCGKINTDDNIYITSVRQIDALKRAKDSLTRVEDSIVNEMPEDFLTIDLMDAYESLGEIIGESVGDEIIDEIFTKFCMGK